MIHFGPKKDLKKLGNHGNQETKIMIFLNSNSLDPSDNREVLALGHHQERS